jgi:hypothetical protein
MSNNNNIKKRIVTLPGHWAPYLINNDASGLEQADLDAIKTACAAYKVNPARCLDIIDDVPHYVRDQAIYDGKMFEGFQFVFAL